MSKLTKEKMIEYDQIATIHFEERKRYDKLKDKENSKYHKELAEKYDNLAHNEMKGLEIPQLYVNQVNKESTRALRCVRYYHYRKWQTSSLKDKERWGIDIVKEASKS
ncbi:hypothetical protein [Niallia circulans]|uniref:hypothetical protein n=1 Tax=Niallia circulans TaxID=1397 RepID=UPI001C3DD354|nr:hypothetical protein [Niallia circulans]